MSLGTKFVLDFVGWFKIEMKHDFTRESLVRLVGQRQSLSLCQGLLSVQPLMEPHVH